LKRVVRSFQARKPEYLNMSGAGDGGQIGDEVVLRDGRSQSRQQYHVGNVLVDRRESVVERFSDNDLF